MILVLLMDLSYKELFKKIKDIEHEIISDIQSGQCLIKDIPELFVSQRVAMHIIVAQDGCLSNIPFSKLDNLSCLAACQLLSTNLLTIPQERMPWVSSQINEPLLSKLDEENKTQLICEKFVILDHRNIIYLPQILKSDRAFIKKLCVCNPKILSILLRDQEDRELCLLAMESRHFTLACIPEIWRTASICITALQRNYREIFSFPTKFIDLKIIKEVIQKCEKEEVQAILDLLPVKEFDVDLVIMSVRKDESSFSKVPYEKITKEMIFEIAPFLNKYETLHHVPEDLFNANLSHRLINCNPMMLYGIPSKFRTKDLCTDAVARCGMALGAVPNHLKNDELYKVAVSNDGLSLKYVPTPYRDNEIPSLAIAQNGEAISYVPEDVIDEVLCRNAILQNPHAIYGIPKKLHCNEFFLIAIKQIPDVLKLVPTDMRTVEQCLIALEQDKTLYNFVPVQLRENPRILKLASRLGLVETIEETD